MFGYLETFKLGRYYFECGIILLKSLLRTSLLYSAECYYNLKETEVRVLEKIKEDYLRQLYKSELGCPIAQLYFESGIYPARFDIIKMQVLFLYHILNQKENSLLYTFLAAQKTIASQR